MGWVTQLCRIIRFNGGPLKSIRVLTRTDDLKIGKFKGRDEMGNFYFENNYYFFLRNRWVLFSNRFGYDYDGSQIHPSWFRWLHYMTDETPEEEGRLAYYWMLPHDENPTGTPHEYVPYSTTKPKILAWEPPYKPCKIHQQNKHNQKE